MKRTREVEYAVCDYIEGDGSHCCKDACANCVLCRADMCGKHLIRVNSPIGDNNEYIAICLDCETKRYEYLRKYKAARKEIEDNIASIIGPNVLWSLDITINLLN